MTSRGTSGVGGISPLGGVSDNIERRAAERNLSENADEDDDEDDDEEGDSTKKDTSDDNPLGALVNDSKPLRYPFIAWANFGLPCASPRPRREPAALRKPAIRLQALQGPSLLAISGRRLYSSLCYRLSLPLECDLPRSYPTHGYTD